MIGHMPRPRPPHLQRQVTQHGRVVWYVRIGKGRRIRIKAVFGTPEFEVEYHAAVTGKTKPTAAAPENGTLAWLWDRYRDSGAWKALSPATRRQRENIMRGVLKTAGHRPYAGIDRDDIVASREQRSSTPAQARNFLDAVRGLFGWAAEAKLVSINPAEAVANPKRREGEGFVAWTEDDVERYQRRWPLGTKERVWLDVLLYSGLRRGDAVRYGRQHVRGGLGRIPTEKSGMTLVAVVPVLPILQATLDAGPVGDMTFIVGANGKPLTKESFGNYFRQACNLAGVRGSAHGVRKIAATTAANNGATVAQLKALFGWTTDSMAALYTKTADRERLAREAGGKLVNDERTSIPSPDLPVRAAKEKRK